MQGGIFISAALILFAAPPSQCFAARQTREQTVSRYVCPMHPDVSAASAGRCSRCGMTLRLPEQPVANRAAAAAAPDQIRNAAVYDQNGQKLFFFEDLIKGKTVVINFIFTTCTTICPPLAANMRQIEKELGQRAGRDVWLVSVSVDPVVDVPERLKAFGAKFGAGPGWTFVTGSKQEIDLLLKSLGAYVSDRNDHSPTTLIINEPAGYWTRAYGLATPSKIAAAIDEAAKKSRR